MTFGQLEILVTLADTKGFTAAARHLGITQPAVSHALKSLENELGVALFERSGSQVEVTEMGARLLQRAREILGLAETMKQEAVGFRKVQVGTLRVGSFGSTSSLQILPDLLDAFQTKYPGIHVIVEEAPDERVATWIEERRVDVGFVVLPDKRFRTIPLVSDQFVALVPAESALAKQSKVSLADLCAEPFISPQAGSAQQVERLFAERRLSPDIRFHVTQILSIITLVSKMRGVSVVAEKALPKATPDDGWVAKPLSPARKRSIGLAVHPTSTMSPALQAFLDLSAKHTTISGKGS